MPTCKACGGDGIKKPIESLKHSPGTARRCVPCRGRGWKTEIPPDKDGWHRVRFQTKVGDVITIQTRAASRQEASRKAQAMLSPTLEVDR